MLPRKRKSTQSEITDYRRDAKRKYIPPRGYGYPSLPIPAEPGRRARVSHTRGVTRLRMVNKSRFSGSCRSTAGTGDTGCLLQYGAGIALTIAALGVSVGLRAWSVKLNRESSAVEDEKHKEISADIASNSSL